PAEPDLVQRGIEARAHHQVHGQGGGAPKAPHELADLGRDDLLHIAVAREGLAHARGVHVQLQLGRAARQHVALEVGRDVEHEGVGARVHARVHLRAVDHGRRRELRRIEGARDALRQRRAVLVHDGDGRVVQALGHGRGRRVDGDREHIGDEHQQHGVAPQAPQLLDAQPVDVGEKAGAHRNGQAQDRRHGQQQRPERAGQLPKSQRLAEHAAADGDHVAGRIDLADGAAHALQRGHGIDQACELRGGDQRADQHQEHRGDLAARQRGGQQAEARGGAAEDQRRQGQRGKAARHGHAEQGDGHQAHQQEVQHGQHHIGQLLAQQEFGARDRRDVEVGDGAAFLLAHHGQRRQHGGQKQQQQGHDGRHHGRQAAHVGVVAKARLDVDEAGRRHAQALARLLGQPVLVDALQVAAHGLGARGHGTVEPGAHLHGAAAQHIARKARGDLDGQGQLAAAHAAVQCVVVGQRRLLDEVA
ncbi:unnamed protein product, partial [Ilex paraguariensis]